ncbi:hypothetical protein [Flexistipes sinusarabici]|nr:hypothetical protein [Flexistipes sinusarabici]
MKIIKSEDKKIHDNKDKKTEYAKTDTAEIILALRKIKLRISNNI